MKDDKTYFLLRAFHAFMTNSQDMIFVKDKDLVYVSASQTFCSKMGGLSVDEVLGKTDFDIFEKALARKYTEDDQKILNTGIDVRNYIEPLPDQNGQKRYSSTSKHVIRDEEGNSIGIYGVARDVTAQIELAVERESGSLSRQMFDGVLEADLTSDRILRLEGIGWTEEQNQPPSESFLEKMRRIGEFVHPDYRESFLQEYCTRSLKENFLLKGIREISHLTYMQSSQGVYRWVECISRIYHSSITDTIRITVFFKDIHEEVQDKKLLQKRADTDALTGLYNRASVLDRIARSISSKDEEELSALLFIDLDCFKQVNDKWGHRFGDKVLKKTANRLKNLLKDKEIFGRIGGDEFLVFLQNVPSKQNVEAQAQRIVDELPFHHGEGDMEIHVTCSVGGVLCNGGQGSVELLYEQADRAMYTAKDKGRNQVYVSDVFCGEG